MASYHVAMSFFVSVTETRFAAKSAKTSSEGLR